MCEDNEYINMIMSKTIYKFDYKQNCFDILRLVAITIVMLSHAFRHFGIEKPSYLLFLTDGSIGVMMFFAMSGFLIMGAYERSLQKGNSYWNFILNRILRLYPAIVCSFLILSIYRFIFTGLSPISIEYLKFSLDYLFLGRYGALWVIPVEIVFYIVTPIVYNMRGGKKYLWILILLIFWQFNIWDKFLIANLQKIPVLGRYFGIDFFICFIYEFLIGSFLYFNKDVIISILEKKWILFLVWGCFIAWYIVYSYTEIIPAFGEMHNAVNGMFVPFLTIFTGYIYNRRIKLDISYGIFIYHMLVINFLKTVNVNGIWGILITLVITPIIALVSAITVERIALRYKK